MPENTSIQPFHDLTHVVSDAKLDIAMQDIRSTDRELALWNSYDAIREAISLPVQRAVWLLREMGINTVSSAANAKHIGQAARIAIDPTTLTDENRAVLKEFGRLNPHQLNISDGVFEIMVPIADGTVTAKAISDEFIRVIDSMGLKSQPALWAAPLTPEQLLKKHVQALYEMQFQDTPNKPEQVNVFDELLKAHSLDADGKLTINEDVYKKYKSSADFLQEHGAFEVSDGKYVFAGVRESGLLAESVGMVFDWLSGFIWHDHKTKEYYRHTKSQVGLPSSQVPQQFQLDELYRQAFHPYISNTTMDTDGILDPLHPKVAEINKYLQGITDTLLRVTGKDPEKTPVKIVLYSAPDNSGALHWGVNPPLIGINLHYWDNRVNEDELAHYIGHELGHRAIRDYTTIHSSNSKAEEITVQAYGLLAIAEAGYDPQSVIQGKKQGASYMYAAQATSERVFGDDHAALAHDVRAMENALAAYERSKGVTFTGNATRPIPKPIQQLAKALPKELHAAGKAARQDREIMGLSVREKILWLHRSLQENQSLENREYVANHVKELTFNPRNVDEREAFNALARELIKMSVVDAPVTRAIRFSWLRSHGVDEDVIRRDLSLSNDKKIPIAQASYIASHGNIAAIPVAELAVVNEHLKQFKNAETLAQAADHAAAAMKLLAHYPNINNRQYWGFEGFDVPQLSEVLKAQQSHRVIAMPYAKHLSWLQESGDENIKELLIRMDVPRDPHTRKSFVPSSAMTPDPIVLLNRAADKGAIGNGAKIAEELFISTVRDAEGNITGVANPYRMKRESYIPANKEWLSAERAAFSVEEALSTEKAWRIKRYQNEQEIVATTDWSTLHQDPESFINRHMAAFIPESGILPSRYPFAERFIEEATQALDAGDATMRNALVALLTEKLPELYYDAYSKMRGDGIIESSNVPHYHIREQTQGFDLSHPIYQFVKTNTHDLLEQPNRDHLFEWGQPLKPLVSVGSVLGDTALDPEIFFKPRVIEHWSDLSINMGLFYPDYKLPETISVVDKELQRFRQLGILGDPVRNLIISDYITNALAHHTLRIGDLGLLFRGLSDTASNYWTPRRQIEDAAASLVQEQLHYARDPETLITAYVDLMATNVIDFRPDIRAQLLDYIHTIYQQEPSAYSQTQRSAWAKMLLESTPAKITMDDGDIHYLGGSYTGSIGDPELRKRLVKNYLAEFVGQHGLDDGSDAYHENVIHFIKGAKRRVDATAYSEILPIFADQIQAQPRTAYAIEQVWKETGIQTIMGKQIAGQYAEFFTNKVTNDTASQSATIEFLTRPIEERSATRYIKAIASLATSDPEVSKLYYRNGAPHSNAMPAVVEFHKNFWNAPMEGRVWYLEKLFFPVQESNEAIQKNTVRDILDRVVPDPESATFKNNKSNHGFDTTSAAIARTIIGSYLDSVSLPEQRLLATAMLVADGAKVTGDNPSVGRTLNVVLSHMGPAGAKLLQAIHSHPATPEQLKKELAESKAMHSVPFRWQIMRWWEAAQELNKNKGKDVKHVGKVEGAGSIVVALDVTMNDGTRVIDRVLRSDVEAQANREFDNMERAIKKASAVSPEVRVVLDMLKEAKRSVAIEADFGFGAAQNTTAEKLYHADLSSTQRIGNTIYEHTFFAAPLIEVNRLAMRIERVEGESFNALKKQASNNPTHPHSEAVTADARSIRSIEFIYRLSGLAVDRDRHGDNLKIDEKMRFTQSDGITVVKRRVGNFDFGAMELAPATHEQKAALGKVLGQALKDAAIGRDFTASLLKHIERLNASPEVEMFLAGIKRGELAQGDYQSGHEEGKAAFTATEMKQLLGYALREGHVDPVIQQSLEHTLGPLKTVVLATIIDSSHDLPMEPKGIPKTNAAVADASPVFIRAHRRTIESGASNGIGVAMGAYGLYSKFNDKDGTYHEDMNSGDAVRQTLAFSGVVSDVVNIAAGAVSTAADMKILQQAKVKAQVAPLPQPSAVTAPNAPAANSASVAQHAEKAAAEALKDGAKAAQEVSKATEKLLKAGKFASKAAIPLAVATGAFDASAGARAGDRERVAGAVGATAGGIVGGMLAGAATGAATGAILGSTVPVIGTIAVGVVAGIGGGIAGAIYGEEAAKKVGSQLAGWITGADDKFMDAMVQLDHATLKKFSIKSVEDVHAVLKSGKMDSVAHVDTSGDGKLTAAELKQALEKARAVFIDNQLTEQLSTLEAKGLGKTLGDKNGKLTLDELKASLKDKNIDLSTLIRDDKIDSKTIADALSRSQTSAVPAPGVPAAAIVAAKEAGPRARV